MSNIFLATSLIFLAEMEVDCVGADVQCDKIYGFLPSSLISNIATITGLLSAFLLPFIGALVDYTDHRHLLGVVASVTLVAIQSIQIYTVESTWFPMAILQAINGFIYQVVTLVAYAYLPEIAAVVEEKKYRWYSSLYYIVMFGHEVLFIAVVVGISVALDFGEVLTAQLGQGVCSFVTAFYFTISWYYFTKRKAKAQLPKGSSLAKAGFVQVFRTGKGIYNFYPKTLGRFFIAVIFGQAGEFIYPLYCFFINLCVFVSDTHFHLFSNQRFFDNLGALSPRSPRLYRSKDFHSDSHCPGLHYSWRLLCQLAREQN